MHTGEIPSRHNAVVSPCGDEPRHPKRHRTRPNKPVGSDPEVTADAPTLTEIRHHWPATIDVPTAGAAFGLSRSHAYELIKRGQFPAKVIQVGSRYRVLTESVINALSDEPHPESHT